MGANTYVYVCACVCVNVTIFTASQISTAMYVYVRMCVCMWGVGIAKQFPLLTLLLDTYFEIEHAQWKQHMALVGWVDRRGR